MVESIKFIQWKAETVFLQNITFFHRQQALEVLLDCNKTKKCFVPIKTTNVYCIHTAYGCAAHQVGKTISQCCAVKNDDHFREDKKNVWPLIRFDSISFAFNVLDFTSFQMVAPLLALSHHVIYAAFLWPEKPFLSVAYKLNFGKNDFYDSNIGFWSNVNWQPCQSFPQFFCTRMR